MDAAQASKNTEQAALLHISLLSSWVVPIPFLGLIVPLIIWRFGQEDHPEIDQHGRHALNWLISSTIYKTVLLLTVVGALLIPVLAGLELVFPIIAAAKASNGRAWKYPLSIDFLGANSKKPFRRAAIGFLPTCILPLIGLIGASYWVNHRGNWLESLSPAQGEVVEMREKIDDEGDTLYNPVIRFQNASGEAHEMSPGAWSSPAPYREGESVDVLYSPDNPEDSLIDNWESKWLMVYAVLVLSAILLVLSLIPSGVCLLMQAFS